VISLIRIDKHKDTFSIQILDTQLEVKDNVKEAFSLANLVLRLSANSFSQTVSQYDFSTSFHSKEQLSWINANNSTTKSKS